MICSNIYNRIKLLLIAIRRLQLLYSQVMQKHFRSACIHPLSQTLDRIIDKYRDLLMLNIIVCGYVCDICKIMDAMSIVKDV